jgi:hypothetical protein
MSNRLRSERRDCVPPTAASAPVRFVEPNQPVDRTDKRITPNPAAGVPAARSHGGRKMQYHPNELSILGDGQFGCADIAEAIAWATVPENAVRLSSTWRDRVGKIAVSVRARPFSRCRAILPTLRTAGERVPGFPAPPPIRATALRLPSGGQPAIKGINLLAIFALAGRT